jgi:squalene synthase HpnC
MAQARWENFPVASRLLPRRIRGDMLTLYGFARLVDDLGDEAEGNRSSHLDWLEAELEAAYQGAATHPLLRRLSEPIARHGIPPEPFRRLIAANRQDQVVRAYSTYEELSAYCELSANPVGHLVLYVLGSATPDRMKLSDAVCTGLQLAEHWQDVAEDLQAGRVYLPRQDMDVFGVSREDLARRPAPPQVRRLLAFEVGRARDLLDRGAPLAARLSGRAGLAVAGFVAGGRAALRAIERAGYDVTSGPPRAAPPRRLWELMKTVGLAYGTGRGGR